MAASHPAVHAAYAEHAAAETPAAKYLLAIKTECCLATALKDAEARARSAVAGEVAATTMNAPAAAGVDPGRIRLQGPQNRSLRSPNPNRMFPRAATRL